MELSPMSTLALTTPLVEHELNPTARKATCLRLPRIGETLTEILVSTSIEEPLQVQPPLETFETSVPKKTIELPRLLQHSGAPKSMTKNQSTERWRLLLLSRTYAGADAPTILDVSKCLVDVLGVDHYEAMLLAKEASMDCSTLKTYDALGKALHAAQHLRDKGFTARVSGKSSYLEGQDWMGLINHSWRKDFFEIDVTPDDPVQAYFEREREKDSLLVEEVPAGAQTQCEISAKLPQKPTQARAGYARSSISGRTFNVFSTSSACAVSEPEKRASPIECASGDGLPVAVASDTKKRKSFLLAKAVVGLWAPVQISAPK